MLECVHVLILRDVAVPEFIEPAPLFIISIELLDEGKGEITAVLALPEILIIEVALEFPVKIVVLPPVLPKALLSPVFAVWVIKLVISDALLCPTDAIFTEPTDAVFVDPAPL